MSISMTNSVYVPPINLRRAREVAVTLPLKHLPPARQTRPGQDTIMIVDDCPPLCDILSRMLAMAGYRIVLATGGLEALRKCRFHQPDLILLDADLPAVKDLYTLLRQEPATRHIPIILTSVDEVWWSQHLIKAGGTIDFLAIPVSYEALLGRVEQWLRQGKSDNQDL